MLFSLFSRIVSGALLPALGSAFNLLALFAPTMAGGLALYLFSKPRPSKARKHQEKFIAGAQKGEILVNGTLIRFYHWEGQGPTILLAHGWESNASRWAPLVGALQEKGYPVFAVDAPGHGASGSTIFTVKMYAEVLQELMHHLKPQVLVGHSAGGMAAVFMLQQSPTSPLQHLILLSVPSELDQLMDTFRRMSFMGDRVFQGMQQAFVQKYGWQMADFSLSRFISNISTPGLLLHDRDDPVAPFSGALEVQRNWRGASFVGFEGLGHSLPGAEVIHTILDYLEEAPRQASVPKADPQ